MIPIENVADIYYVKTPESDYYFIIIETREVGVEYMGAVQYVNVQNCICETLEKEYAEFLVTLLKVHYGFIKEEESFIKDCQEDLKEKMLIYIASKLCENNGYEVKKINNVN